MEANALRNGQRLDWKQYWADGELDKVLRNIFTNNPSYWDNSPLYLDYHGNMNRAVNSMLSGDIAVFEHEFPFIRPDENHREEMTLFEYCCEISKARTNILLPLVYYNAILYLDVLNLSFEKIDNSSKIMLIRKNTYHSILSKIKENISNPFYLYFHFRDIDNFIDLNTSITCECGSVNAYRVELGLFHNESNYVIFPFPTDEDETVGKMYYFEKAI